VVIRLVPAAPSARHYGALGGIMGGLRGGSRPLPPGLCISGRVK